MKKHVPFSLLTGFMCLLFTNLALGCESGHWIESKSNDGSIITLEDGSVWEVDSIDTINTSLWLETNNIVACPEKDSLINVDEGEQVSARQLR